VDPTPGPPPLSSVSSAATPPIMIIIAITIAVTIEALEAKELPQLEFRKSDVSHALVLFLLDLTC
jgi:hypothetical protein